MTTAKKIARLIDTTARVSRLLAFLAARAAFSTSHPYGLRDRRRR